MGLFGPSRDAQDPFQLQIAAHELGHAAAWKGAGLQLRGVRHFGDRGECGTRWWPSDEKQVVAYAVGCWGGLEAEVRWCREFGGRARRSNSGHDISDFRAHIREFGLRLSESKARSLARKHVNAQWPRITRLAPELVRKGRLSGL